VTDDVHLFRETLEQMRRQLEEADRIDPKVAESLDAVIRELETILGREEVPERTHRSLLERLGHAARHFEESHPTLSATVGQLIDMLGQMGI
jgi:hypothetical protein